MRSTLPEELAARSNARSAEGEETSAPSIMKTMPLPGMPRIDALAAVWGPLTIERPGVYFRYSPMLPSPRSPISSSTITFLIFGDIFCSFTAAAAALRAVDSTTKLSSFTVLLSSSVVWSRGIESSKSWRAVVAAATFIRAVFVSIPA